MTRASLMTPAGTLVAMAGAAVLVACGGGGDSGDGGTSLFEGYGPGNPSACPHTRIDDVWLDQRLSCLAAGQLFIQSAVATGETADRAYIVGQEVLDTRLANILGSGVQRHFKYALCVRGAPVNLSPTTLVGDLAVALGLNTLAVGFGFYPPGVAGSTLSWGGIVDANTLVTPCDPSQHPVIVDYASRRIHSVNPGALARLQVFDR